MLNRKEIMLTRSPQFHDWMEMYKGRHMSHVEVKLAYILMKDKECGRLGKRFDLDKFIESINL